MRLTVGNLNSNYTVHTYSKHSKTVLFPSGNRSFDSVPHKRTRSGLQKNSNSILKYCCCFLHSSCLHKHRWRDLLKEEASYPVIMDPQEELRGFVDNDQFVSYRWLAFCLNIHVEKSKSILEKFKNSNNDISATYCVSGQLKNKQQSISVVSEKNLARCKDLFEVINCTHIYSIQKNKFAESTNVPLQLNAADVQQANELIAQQPHCIPLLLNSAGGIKLEGSDVQAIGKRVAAIVRTITTSGTDSNIENAEGGMSKAFATASNSTKEKNGALSSSGKDGSKDKSKEKSKSVASAFFANSTSSTPAIEKPKPVKKVPINGNKTVPAAKIAPIISKGAAGSKLDDGEGEDEDDEWTEEGGESYKPDKKKLKNRKNVPTDSKVMDGETLVTSPPSIAEIEEHDDNAADSGEVKKAQLHVHGAMDDYMEDVAIEKYKAGQLGDSNAEPVASGKRTKRKLVEKVMSVQYLMLDVGQFFLRLTDI